MRTHSPECCNPACDFEGIVVIRQIFVLVLALAGCSESALALSCQGTEDRFFFRCEAAQQCKAQFRAREIQIAGGCTRRVLVEKVPADVQLAVQQQLDAPLATGAYEITLIHRYYSDPPVTAQELNHVFTEQSLRKPRMSVRVLAASSDLEALEGDWVRRERAQYLRMLGVWAIEGSMLLVFLVGAYATTRTFQKRLRDGGRSGLLRPVLLQIMFFAAALLSLALFGMPILIGLTAPLWVAVWLYEAGTLARRWLARRRAGV